MTALVNCSAGFIWTKFVANWLAKCGRTVALLTWTGWPMPYFNHVLVGMTLGATLLPVATAATLGVGTFEGTSHDSRSVGPVRGYIAVLDTRDRSLLPVASTPDPARCEDGQTLARETTTAWQRRTGAMLAINGGFWYMPSGQLVPECQLPPRPYKSAGLLLSSDSALPPAPVLALGLGKAPRIGYSDDLDVSGYEVVVSGDWIRSTDRQTIHRTLLLDGGQLDKATKRGPRTAVGVDRVMGRLIVVMVEGRRADSDGLSLNALARLMSACGASEAMNLDGGGSSTFGYVPPRSSNGKVLLTKIAIGQVCKPEVLREQGFVLAVAEHSLDKPLRSRPPGGRGSVQGGPDSGYRPVLNSLGFLLERDAPAQGSTRSGRLDEAPTLGRGR